jgi:integrase
MKNRIKNSIIVQDFINSFPNKRTRQTYESNLKDFFNYVKKEPDTYIKDIRLLSKAKTFQQTDTYERDIKKYWLHQIKQNRAPKTITSRVNTIKLLLIQNKIELDNSVWMNIRRRGKGNQPITEDLAPSTSQLKEILQHATINDKALFLTLFSSGIRISEATAIKLTDIDFKSTPTKITISSQYAKNKKKRITFITDEATEATKAWLKVRKQWLENTSKITHITRELEDKTILKISKSPNDDRLFPTHANTARARWNNLLTKAKLNKTDTNTKYHKLRLHTLRKAFRTQFSKYNHDIAEILLGHEGYLNISYARFTEDELKEEYLKASKYLKVYETQVDLTKIYQQIKELKEENILLKESLKLHDFMLKQISKHPKKTAPKDALNDLLKFNKKNLTKEEQEIIKEKIKQIK